MTEHFSNRIPQATCVGASMRDLINSIEVTCKQCILRFLVQSLSPGG
jgi:hypothetical protein